MIDNVKIIVGIVMTNVVDNYYWPATEAAVKSYSNADFVDEIVIVDGQSIDDTVKKHENIRKVKFLNGPKWDTNVISEYEFSKQRNVIYRHCDNLCQDVILIFQCPDTFFTHSFNEECKHVIKNMLKAQKDFCVVPYAKLLTPWQYLRYNYKIFDDRWSEICIMKFHANDNAWIDKLHEIVQLDLTSYMSKYMHNWVSAPLTYDMWHFDREKFCNRLIKREGIDHTTYMNEMEKIFRTKIQQNTLHSIKLSEHPPEAEELLLNLKDDQYGFSAFGYFKNSVSFEEFNKERKRVFKK